ncbi:MULTISPECIES: hypothetical protein [unclassified Curtobacterium]|nr:MULTISPECIES: hypothetical protein [unclassified Curtobacterium]WIB64154.1 hypothetical protein DEI94_02860 [Curtobacterium sp. MCBD17_040]
MSARPRSRPSSPIRPRGSNGRAKFRWWQWTLVAALAVVVVVLVVVALTR